MRAARGGPKRARQCQPTAPHRARGVARSPNTSPPLGAQRLSITMSASTASSGTDVDAGAETEAPQLAALFLIRFDKKVGYVTHSPHFHPPLLPRPLLTRTPPDTLSRGSAAPYPSRSTVRSSTSRCRRGCTRCSRTLCTLCTRDMRG